MLKAPMLFAAVLVVCVASSADARRRHHHGYYGYGENAPTLDDWRRARDAQSQGQESGQDRGQALARDRGEDRTRESYDRRRARYDEWRRARDDLRRSRDREREDSSRRREAERGDAALRPGRGGPFAAVVEKLVRGCGAQGAEFDRWPFDAIAQIVGADEKERTALAALRERAKAATERLAADCPQDVPAAPSARLEAVEQGIDAALAAFDQVQPALATFYGALDDEQKARLYRDMAAPAVTARETMPRRQARDDRRASREYRSRRDRWRAYAAARGARARDRAPPSRRAALERHVRRVCGGAAQLAGARDRARRAFELPAARRVLRARHRLAQGRRHARERLPRRERAHPGRPHGRDAPAPCRRARRHRRDPPRARAVLRGARPGAEGEVCGDELKPMQHRHARA
jgi:hypothetical protein